MPRKVIKEIRLRFYEGEEDKVKFLNDKKVKEYIFSLTDLYEKRGSYARGLEERVRQLEQLIIDEHNFMNISDVDNLLKSRMEE